MEVLYLLVPMSLLLAGLGLLAFLWANRQGQFDDLQSPAEAILHDDRQDKHPQ
jgi:cbb3-type cytochrome oxidase maturation protein